MEKKDFTHIVTVSVCIAIFIAFLLCAIFLPSSNIAEEENRTAASFPAFSVKSLINGDFFKNFSDFFSDSFPLRSSLIGLNATVRLALGEQESNGVFYGRDQALIFKGEYDSLATAQKNSAAISTLESSLGATVAVIPRACDVCASQLPKTYDPRRQNEIYGVIDAALPNAEKLRNSISERLSAISQPFYQTDHHWTSEGAYSAYRAIIEELGMTPYEEDLFLKETVTESFFGTAYSRSSLRFVSPDSITLYRYPGDESYTVKAADTNDPPNALYDFSALDKKDKYQIFLGGNYSRLTVSSSAERPTLLLIKDSFANALIPFLALHFNIEAIDPRYCAAPISTLISDIEHDRALIIFGADTLATTAMYNKLR